MRIKYFLIIFILLLALNACGKKGPVRPVDTTLLDQEPKKCSN